MAKHEDTIGPGGNEDTLSDVDVADLWADKQDRDQRASEPLDFNTDDVRALHRPNRHQLRPRLKESQASDSGVVYYRKARRSVFTWILPIALGVGLAAFSVNSFRIAEDGELGIVFFGWFTALLAVGSFVVAFERVLQRVEIVCRTGVIHVSSSGLLGKRGGTFKYNSKSWLYVCGAGYSGNGRGGESWSRPNRLELVGGQTRKKVLRRYDLGSAFESVSQELAEALNLPIREQRGELENLEFGQYRRELRR